MKRYDKDGKEIEMPNLMDFDKDISEQASDYVDIREWNKALTPQQMAEKIKELEHEVKVVNFQKQILGEGVEKYKTQLKDSQQDKEDILQALKDKLNSYNRASDYYLERWGTRDCITLVEQLLETKQKQEG